MAAPVWQKVDNLAVHQLERIVGFDGQEFLVAADTEEFRRWLSTETARAQVLTGPLPEPFSITATPDTVSWERHQTPCRNQGNRGSCWAFAAIAALEAQYRRQHGLDLDLSEQYFFHLGRGTGLRGDYLTTHQRFETASSYWGGGGAAASIGALVELTATEERHAPYLSQDQLDGILGTRPDAGPQPWLPWSPEDSCPTTQEQIDALEWDDRLIGRAARWEARYRVQSWQPLPDVQTATLERWIAAGHDLTLDINVKWQFNAGTETYEADDSSGGGWHCVLLVGYDRPRQRFLMKNSWGEGRIVGLSYEMVRRNAAGAAAITAVAPPSAPDRRHWWLGCWNMDHDGWRGCLVIRRFAAEATPTKLGNYYRAQDGATLDVNGYMAQDGLRMSFTIAPNPGRRQPGVLDGQRFHAYVFSWDQANAAGVTTWNGIPFGARMSRDPLPPHRPGRFEPARWQGAWLLNHDGWRGTLTVDNLTELGWPVGTIAAVRYTNNDGREFPAEAILTANRPHEMHLNITFDGYRQPFSLYHHTWEPGLLSGTTVWGGATFGVIGRHTDY